MSDLVRVLRGQRIDGRGADEIMRRAADEIERLRAALAAAERERDALRDTLIDTRRFIVIACGEHGPSVKIALSKIDAALKERQP